MEDFFGKKNVINLVKKHLWITLSALGFLLAVCLGVFLLARPRFVWVVEDQFYEKWQQIAPSAPFRMTKMATLSAIGDTMPRRWYGYRISAPDGDENPIRVYENPAEAGRSEGALLLALDPWLVFRRAATPPLSREMAERGPPEWGQIFIAGGDKAAVRAWTAQLLQESPGVFSRDEERWNRIGERLFIGRNFQPGAQTYRWEQVWPYLLAEDEAVWAYCPLSEIRQLPQNETNVLAADVFPARPGWSEYGLQVETLWATPYGSEKNRKKLKSAENWLQTASAQSQIADAFGWLAAHPQASPASPVLQDAHAAWIAASYVWEADWGE